MSFELFLFYAFGSLAVFSAIAMVGFVRHIVAGAMSMVVTMISLAGIYVLLSAELVGAIQIMVYAGAILVLFLFVLMLLNLRSDDFGPANPRASVLRGAGAAGAVAIAALLLVRIPGALPRISALDPESAVSFGGYRALGLALYGPYVLVVEVAGLILLAAIVGAVILAKRQID